MMTNNTPIQSQTVDHLMMANKAANKVTKVRRTRQPRNPQLSVARRNERERNRVKMVNNGFALLREHLPVEDLAACEQSGSDTPTPDGGSQAGAKSKAKKFSKVETLRAAIQRIKVLEELIRSTDPTFESMNIGGQQVSGMFIDEEPFSVCEPLSISSSNSASTMHNLQDIQNQQAAIYGQREQFIKLEPQQQQQQPLVDMPSPQDSHTSNNSGLNQHHQHRYSPATSSTQVHHLSQHQHHHHQEPSHTHLWIQQHQNSFIEQQQQQQYQQQQMSLSETTSPTNNHWFAQRQQVEAEQKSNWFIQQQQQQQHNETAEPEPTSNQLLNSQHQSPSSQQSLQVDSPVWFNNSPGAPANQVNSNSQPMQVFGQHHQISLYSQ